MPTSNFFQSRQGINITPGATSVASEGDIGFNSTTHKLEYRDNTATRSVVSEDGTQTLTNKTMSGGSNTFSNIAYSSLVLTNTIVNADINASAAIAYSKLNLTGSIVNADINASAAIAYSKLTLTGSIVNADVNAGAAIAYSKLALSNSIVNADIGAGAAIAYSKLNLATSIVNGDIAVAAAITRTKLANGSASHVLINDGSGIISSEATLAKSRGGAGADQSSVTYPATGTIQATTPNNHGVLVSGAAAIATVIAPNASTAFPLISGGASADPGWSALTPGGGGTGQTSYAKGDILVASGASTLTKLAVGTDGQVAVADSSQTNGVKWTTLAQGAKNYITYNSFENNATTGWSLNHTTLASGIPNQASGSWTAASGSYAAATVSGAGVLAGTYSMQLTWVGTTSVAGDMLVSQAYTIDAEDQAKVLSFKFYYSTITGASLLNFSGTSSNTYQIYIYDVANSVWIQPAGVYSMVQGSGAGIAQGTFQTPSNMTQFRIAVVCVNASASGSHTLNFDDFYVGPQALAFGPAMTDSSNTGATFTLNGLGTVTGQSIWWKRDGDKLKAYGVFETGTVAASTASITLPFAYDSTKSTSQSSVQGVGHATLIATGVAVNVYSSSGQSIAIFYDGSDTTKLYFAVTVGSNVFTKVNGSTAFNNTQWVYVEFEYPVAGWSSQTTLSADSDTRVVAFEADTQTPTGTISGAYNIVKFGTVAKDTHGGYNTSTGLYTVPVSGYYAVSATLEISASFAAPNYALVTVQRNAQVASPAVGAVKAQATLSTIFSPTCNGVIFCNAGDTLGVYSISGGSSPTYSNATSGSSFSINRLSGPAVVAASESVNCRYTNTAGTTLTKSANNTVPFATKDYDTHGAWVTNTFTAPMAGKYAVKANINIAAGATWASSDYVEVDVWKNGSTHTVMVQSIYAADAASVKPGFVSATVNCVAGDTITINCFPNKASAGNVTLNSSTGLNSISIERIGN
jgi:hypothetical protein